MVGERNLNPEVTEELARDLVRRADGDPAAVMAEATQLLAEVDPDAVLNRDQALVAWGLGLAARHLRHLDLSLHWLERAAAATVRGGEDHTGIELSRSSTLTYQGHLDEALTVLATLGPPADMAPRVACQIATIHEFRGELRPARAGYEAAVLDFQKLGDVKGEAHALVGLGLVDVAEGHSAAAVTRFATARTMYRSLGDDVLAAVTDSNIGYAAAEADDLVTALDHLAAAGAQLRAAGEPFAETALEHAVALLKAGLAQEAIDVIAQVLPHLEAAGAATDRAELLVTLGRTLANHGQHQTAEKCFRVAHQLFANQGRERWVNLARLGELENDLATERRPTHDIAQDALGLAETFGPEDPKPRTAALVSAARAAARHADVDTLTSVQSRLAASTSPSLHTLVECYRLRAEHRPARVVDRVLQYLRDPPETGVPASLDIRAARDLAVDELLDIGFRAAIELHDAEAVVDLTVAAAGPVGGAPAVLPQEDPLGSEIRKALRADLDSSGWQVISERVRAGRRQPEASTSVDRKERSRTIPPGAIILLAAGDTIAAVEAGSGGAMVIGRHDRPTVVQALDRHRTLLASAVTDPDSPLAGMVQASAESLGRILPWLDRDDLCLITHGDLALAPWSSVAPCPVRLVSPGAGRLRRHVPSHRHVVAVGPDTRTARDEAAALRNLLGSDAQLEVVEATPEAVLTRAPRAEVLHLSCHAVHNRANPLLSSYRLHGGHLRGYEIERMTDAPRIVLSSACAAGRQQRRGYRVVLGLPSTWLAAGAASVVAPLCPIPDDQRTVDTFTAVHEQIARGIDVSAAVHASRDVADGMVARTLLTFGSPRTETR